MPPGKSVSAEIRQEIRTHFIHKRYSRKELAEQYGLSLSTIARITRHLTGKPNSPEREIAKQKREKIRELTKTGNYSRNEIAKMLDVSYAYVMNAEVDHARYTVSPEEAEEIRKLLSSSTYTREELAHKYRISRSGIQKITTGIKVKHRIPSKHLAEMRTLYSDDTYTIQQLSVHYGIHEVTIKKHLRDLLPVYSRTIEDNVIEEMRRLFESGECYTVAEVAQRLAISDQSVRKYAGDLIPQKEPQIITEATIEEIRELYKTGRYSQEALSIQFSIGVRKIAQFVSDITKPKITPDCREYVKRPSSSEGIFSIPMYV